MCLWCQCRWLLTCRWLLSLSDDCWCLGLWIDLAPAPALILVVSGSINILGTVLNSRLVHLPLCVCPEMIRLLGTWQPFLANLPRPCLAKSFGFPMSGLSLGFLIHMSMTYTLPCRRNLVSLPFLRW